MNAPVVETLDITGAELVPGDTIRNTYAGEWCTVLTTGEPFEADGVELRYIGLAVDDVPEGERTAWYELDEPVTVRLPRPTVIFDLGGAA